MSNENEHVVTWQVRREALRMQFPDVFDVSRLREPHDDDSLWLVDFKTASADDKLLMIGAKLDELWHQIDHLEQHACDEEKP